MSLEDVSQNLAIINPTKKVLMSHDSHPKMGGSLGSQNQRSLM